MLKPPLGLAKDLNGKATRNLDPLKRGDLLAALRSEP